MGWTDLSLVNKELKANHLINGGGDIFQRTNPSSLIAVSDDVYGPDRWNILTQTASVQIQRTTGNTAKNAIQIKQNQASAQRFGMEQIIEGINCYHLRNKIVRFQGRIKCSSAQTIRAALIEWTGTVDSVTSDIVNTWTNEVYTAGQFFTSTSTVVTAVDGIMPSANVWTDLVVTGRVSNACNNLIAFIWAEGTAAQDVTLDVTEAGLYQDSVMRRWIPRPFGQEVELCQRYYEKSYALDTAPGTSFTQGNSPINCIGAISTFMMISQPFVIRKRTIPTFTVYDAAGTANAITWHNGSTYADGGAASVGVYEHGFHVQANNLANNIGFNCAFTADAEL